MKAADKNKSNELKNHPPDLIRLTPKCNVQFSSMNAIIGAGRKHAAEAGGSMRKHAEAAPIQGPIIIEPPIKNSSLTLDNITRTHFSLHPLQRCRRGRDSGRKMASADIDV